VTVNVRGPVADQASLAPAVLVEEARRMTGATPDEPLRYLRGLRELTTALDAQAGLSTAGRIRVQAALVAALTTQIHVRRLVTAVPQIHELPVRPVFITGLLRTGTTFLQHLLVQHPGLQSPRLWELMSPAGPGGADELIAACTSYIEEYYRAAPQFRTIHPLVATLPEECHRLTANTFRDSIYGLRYRVPGYLDWLRGRSMVPAYLAHRLQLQCILWRRPGSPAAWRTDRPVILKCPSHLWHLDALRQVYPNATVIRMHRSPAVAIPSVCSLTAVVRAARSPHVDRLEIGQYWLDQATAVLAGIRRGIGPLAIPPLDIRYADLVADPLRVAEQVCDHIGVPLTEPARRAMSAFLATKSDAAPGRHHYSAEDFGLNRRMLDERFAGYLAEFDL
jgi:hypothetical protein